MRLLRSFILFLFATSAAFAQLPNDCVNAITICGNGTFSSNASGYGVQEVAGCSGFEHNSIWLKINIVNGGTLGFNLTPTSTSLNVDYDFWVYGPDDPCNALGSPIRCCTTNPILAGVSTVTGMAALPLSTTSGPGANGNGFVRWLDVLPGQSYYIAIDRPVGDGGFQLQWTGTAMNGSGAFPSPPTANSLGEIKSCSNNANIGIFDLNSLRSQINSDLISNTISFHLTSADATDGINPLPSIYGNTSNPQTIYARVKNNFSGCFTITSFQLKVYQIPDATVSTPTPKICFNGNSVVTFNGTPNAIIEYTVNNGPTQTATLSNTGVFQITGQLLATTTYKLTLAKIVDASNTTLCSKVLNNSATVTVSPLATATISNLGTICSDAIQTLTFNSLANATINYTINGGTNQTAVLDNTGQLQVNLSGLAPGDYTVLISSITEGTIPNCTTNVNISSTFSVQPVLFADIAVSSSVVCSGTSATITFTGTPNTTVTYKVNGGANQTISLDNSGTASITTSALVANQTYDLVNVFTSAPACSKTETDSVTITVITQPTVTSFTGTTAICSGTSTNLTFVGTPNATVTYSNGTSDQTVVLDGSGNGIVSVNPTTTTTYSLVSISIASTPICSNSASGNVVVTVSNTPVAGTDGTITICETSSATIDLFSLISGEQTGGTWSRNTGTGGIFNQAAGTFTPAVGATTSTFTYTLIGTLPCVNVSSLATINISPQPNAGTDSGGLLYCETDSSVIDLYSLVIGEQSGGTWTRTTGTGGTFNAAAGTFTLSVGVTNSSFTYTISGFAPCISDSSVVSVTIAQQPIAGTDGVISVCEVSSTAVDLFSLITGEQTGGTWTRTGGIGGTFDGVAGTFTPASGATNSAFTYTLIGTLPCVNDSSLATINITPQLIAGTDGSTSICESSTTTIDLFSLITGEQSGGTWTRTTGTGGTFNQTLGTFTPAVGANSSSFTYTLLATLPCLSDSSVASVTISPAPTGIGILGSTTTCAGIPVNLTVTATPGTVITWTATPGTSSSFTIGASGSNVISVSPTVNTTYTLTSASLNGCTIPVVGQSATVMVSATPQFVTQIPDMTICNGEILNIASQLTSTVLGATFNWSASYSNTIGKDNLGNIITSGDENNIDQLVSLTNNLQGGTITILVNPQIGSCSGDSQQIVIKVNPIPTIISTVADKTTLCNNEFVTITSNSNPVATTYNWQINTANGVQIVGGATNGSSVTGIINLQLVLTNPLVAGTISFDFTPFNGICTGATVSNAVTITVNPIPGSPIGLPQPEICSGETTNINVSENLLIPGTQLQWEVIASNNVTGFSQTGIGLAPISIQDVLVNISDVQGSVTYRITSVIGQCEGSFTDIIVLVNPLPKPNLVDGYICVNQTTNVAYQSYILDTQLLNPDFTYDWFVLNTTTGAYDALASANTSTYEVTIPGTYQVIVTNTVTNCQSVPVQAIVTTVYPATAFSTIVSDAFSDNTTITVTVNPIGTGNLIYSLDGGAWQSSNVFTGVEAGSHEVMVEDLEGCTNLTEEIEVIDYPKYFTPNGDGIHDTWNVLGLNQAGAKLYIFDRYGKLIKQLNPSDGSVGWDGTYNGQQAPSSDYWFTIDFAENNQQKQFKAHFSLKR
ncbi:MAG: T9SS type B sorting domain-containing protein [Bacteroidota bacterium]